MAEQELGWNRGTVRKGLQELENGPIRDKFAHRGRKTAEKHFPHLLEDIKDVVEKLKKSDAVFLQTGYYISISAAQVRQKLILWKGYSDDELPTRETIRKKMRQLHYRYRRA